MVKGFFPKIPKSKKEEEFGPGKKDIMICPDCEAVYYYKSWHHNLENYPNLNESKDVNFFICPACKMIKSKQYEGEVIIENTPLGIKEEIKNLISKFGETAWKKDPLDRIISVKEKGKKLTILTTENQLAQKLGKKISKVFGKKHKIEISHSDSEDVIRVKVYF